MRTRIISILILSITILSCKKEIDNPNDTPTNITISASKTEITADFSDYSSLSVIDDVGNDRTSDSEFYINDELFASSIFSTKNANTYTIHAEFETLVSNEIQITATEAPLKSIHIECSKTEAYADGIDSVILAAYTDLRKDISNEARFYANDVEMTSNTYKTTNIGDVSFEVTYNGFSDTAKTKFKEKPTYAQRSLIEDYTGTWCGYCPRVSYAIEDVTSRNDNIVAMGIHYNDPMEYEHINSMVETFNVNAFPTAIANRGSVWNETYENIAPADNEFAPLDLSISSNLDGNSASINIKVQTVSWYENQLKLVVCLTEDDLQYNQQNYYNDGKGNPIVNFEHNHVLRKAFTDIYGDELTDKNQNNEYEKSFNVTINPKYETENCDIVAFVVLKSNNRVVNVQKTKLGQSVDF